MDSLSTLKALQEYYQEKFAELIAIHNSKTDIKLETPEYFRVRDEWIKAGEDIKQHLEAMNVY